MKPIKQLLGGALLLEIPRFEDHRGTFAVPFEAGAAEAAGVSPVLVQDSQSYSKAAGTIRGLHLQLPPAAQGKLVRVLTGRIADVFVDLRPGSDTRGGHEIVELAADDDRLLWVPAGLAHGFCTLEPDTRVHYKVDAPYAPDREWTLAWDDPSLAIDWPLDGRPAVLSAKDWAGRNLAETLAAVEAAEAAIEPPVMGTPAVRR